MSLKIFWEQIDTLIQKYEKTVDNDLKNIFTVLSSMSEKGKQLEGLWNLVTLVNLGKELDTQSQELNRDGSGVPEVKAGTINFLEEYLRILARFEQNIRSSTLLIRNNCDSAVEKVKGRINILEERINRFKQEQLLVSELPNQGLVELAIKPTDEIPQIKEVDLFKKFKLELQEKINESNNKITILWEIFLSLKSESTEKLSGLLEEIKFDLELEKSAEEFFKQSKIINDIRQRIELFKKNEAELSFTDSYNGIVNHENIDDIYNDFKKYLTPDQIDAWDKNESLSSWSAKRTYNYLYSFVSSASEKPKDRIELFEEFLSSHEKQNLDSGKEAAIQQIFKLYNSFNAECNEYKDDLAKLEDEEQQAEKLEQSPVQEKVSERPKITKPEEPQSNSLPREDFVTGFLAKYINPIVDEFKTSWNFWTSLIPLFVASENKEDKKKKPEVTNVKDSSSNFFQLPKLISNLRDEALKQLPNFNIF